MSAAPAIDEALVRSLLREQFPRWADLPLRRVARDGWDNRSFRLGDDKVARLPSAAAYAVQVEKEQRWLPVLSERLAFPVPVPVAQGVPGQGYPWPWSIYQWIEGDVVDPRAVEGSTVFASDVAAALAGWQALETVDAPAPGEHNFHRGGPLGVYDSEVREALRRLGSRVDARGAIALWEAAVRTSWERPAVWVHGDVASANLLERDGRLCGVLDFGSLAVGDPACDLAIAWTVFRGDARRAFLEPLAFDPATLLRARAWALWKGAILAAGLARTNATEWNAPLKVLDEVLGRDDLPAIPAN